MFNHRWPRHPHGALPPGMLEEVHLLLKSRVLALHPGTGEKLGAGAFGSRGGGHARELSGLLASGLRRHHAVWRRASRATRLLQGGLPPCPRPEVDHSAGHSGLRQARALGRSPAAHRPRALVHQGHGRRLVHQHCRPAFRRRCEGPRAAHRQALPSDCGRVAMGVAQGTDRHRQRARSARRLRPRAGCGARRGGRWRGRRAASRRDHRAAALPRIR
mmetsp:Transcript_106671/g.270883  ORF Transcript_106671/g.270883 Transcript_106671/m.270883 type:complete len:217 (+) Transcript_106671:479-1129(+)